MKPRRYQRKRTKGWTMPDNTVYVGRPTKWGNPYRPGVFYFDYKIKTIEEAVLHYKITRGKFGYPGKDEIVKELKGKNLACWCPLDQPCHADVLLEIANG